MKYKVFSILILILLVAVGVYAQCPMCKMTAETNMKNGGMAGRGLNQGILYLLLLPYLAMMIIGYLYWKGKKNLKSES
ncbi:MAG TPA: hypothetical protein PK622_11885 [Saprospiraceae bacterium]|jgi:hypothetical protein|nr:hypothetical protein [Saprospiraceae bacterium]HOJ91760.1 hypothetical protein [Saprospiraceae bacterium]HUN17511.1 hypothetical protein [Saprospiraceae bacterium]